MLFRRINPCALRPLFIFARAINYYDQRSNLKVLGFALCSPQKNTSFYDRKIILASGKLGVIYGRSIVYFYMVYVSKLWIIRSLLLDENLAKSLIMPINKSFKSSLHAFQACLRTSCC